MGLARKVGLSYLILSAGKKKEEERRKAGEVMFLYSVLKRSVQRQVMKVSVCGLGGQRWRCQEMERPQRGSWWAS